ncbi:hypothetical protein T266_07735 [Pseudomonas aeruginosa VRFPA05]|nr:hypothetical protein T266_07735 [Pseudomonas aeruginosa VRFPA05]
MRVANASCDHFGLFDRAGVAGPGNRRERRAELAGDGAATLGRGDAVVLAAMHLARSSRLPVAQQVVAAEQLDGLAVASGLSRAMFQRTQARASSLGLRPSRRAVRSLAMPSIPRRSRFSRRRRRTWAPLSRSSASAWRRAGNRRRRRPTPSRRRA